jgi:hypothetical protein
MEAFLDDQVLPVSRPTLAGVLDAARERAHAAGRVVIEVKRNGLPVDSHELDEPPESPEPSATFRLLSADAHALVRTTFMDVADMLPPAREALTRSAINLQTGKVQEACAELSDALEAFDTVRGVIQQGPALLGCGADELLSGGGASVTERLGVLSGHLESVRTALMAQDWAGLADLLEGELAEDAGEWGRVLGMMAEGVRARGERRAGPSKGGVS